MVKISQKLVEHVINLSYMNPSDVELRSLAYLVNSAAGKEFEESDRLVERLSKYIPLESLVGYPPKERNQLDDLQRRRELGEAVITLQKHLSGTRAKLIIGLLVMEIEHENLP